MKHSDVQRHMPDFLEGTLPLGRRALFDAHLDECADCAREVTSFQLTIAALRGLPEPVVPADLTANVMRRIRMGEGQTSLLDRIQAIGAALFAPRILAPVSAAMLVAGLVLGTADLRNGFGVTLGDGPPARPGRITDSSRGTEIARADVDASRSLRGAEPPITGSIDRFEGVTGGSATPATQGQEFIALTQRMDERSGIRTRFNDWPSVRPAHTVAVALNPVGPVVERATGRLLTDQLANAGQRWPSADEWLVHVQQRPTEFADLMALRTLAEQEHWIDHLARRALAKGELDQIVTALRTSGSERARILADDFASMSSSGADRRFAPDRRN